MDISIIIVNWNTCSVLKDCLASIFGQQQTVSFEVIVVDNASSDKSVEMVSQDFPDVKIIQNSENRGFAAANNQGIASASGRYVLLLNSDTVILNDALGKTVGFADSRSEAAVIGCRVLNLDGSLQRSCFMFPSILNLLLNLFSLHKLWPRSKFFGRERMSWWDFDTEHEVDAVVGCFMLVRKEALEQAGGMDEEFFMYAEEADWCYRFKKAGWKILFTPEAEIIHLEGQSSKLATTRMLLQLYGSTLKFIRKHYSKTGYKTACVLIWLFFAIRVPVWFFRASLSKAEKKYCRMRLSTYIDGMKKLARMGAEGLCVGSCDIKV